MQDINYTITEYSSNIDDITIETNDGKDFVIQGKHSIGINGAIYID